ncbi:MAG: ribosomal RNA small subunit methyltransferase A [Candidatus Didemnitutus sp.]|nr:ribosomal RNA small subunit methyltransferase A [Candidatus Didemnitutus sp.]
MPLTLTGTRELLARLGHSPKRFLGQNYLIDGNIVRKSVELGAVAPGDTVVEVGPGLGTLTSALLAAGAEVFAVEKDATMAAHLRGTLAVEHPGKLHLIEEDAVAHPIAGLPPERAANFKIVANLPYAISTPWMDAVLGGPLPQRMVLMLQQEAAQRYVAQPGTKQFGAISIFIQSAFAADPGHKVPATCFYPAPDVESYLLNLARRPEPFIFAPTVKRLIRECFQQRRKQIGSLLRGKLPDGGAAWLAHLPEAGLDPRARPEQIPVALWQRLGV